MAKWMGLAGPKQTGLAREEAARRSRKAAHGLELPLELASGVRVERCAASLPPASPVVRQIAPSTVRHMQRNRLNPLCNNAL